METRIKSRTRPRMEIGGVPDWLEAHVLRGLSAVWEEIPAEDVGLRLETLALVAGRLFPGYDVTVDARKDVRRDADPFSPLTPSVSLRARNPVEWSVALVLPELRDPVISWFERDTPGMADEVALLLRGLPAEALAWADSALGDRVGEIVGSRLPGWDFSLLVRLDNDSARNAGVLQIAFRPRQPLVLAVVPSIFSSTLPVMFQSDLTAKLVSGLSPIIGLPVEWAAFHGEDAALLARSLLEDRNAVANTRSRVNVAFAPGQVSKVDATVNSERFVLQVWLAAYAGVEERYPELGILAGWNTKLWTGIDLELYDEAVVDIGGFGLANRLGLRFPLGRRLRLGVEVEWPEQEIWYRAGWDPGGIRRPYAWWRYNGERGHNAALGYRIDEHISIEIHYDGRYDEKVGIRGILLL